MWSIEIFLKRTECEIKSIFMLGIMARIAPS